MSRTIKVTYNSDTLETTIIVDGKAFDTSRINGKEIADWAYPFMMRKTKWNGFYDEMVEALGGEKEFNLVFEGSEAELNELKEAWEDAPVTVVSEESSENIVVIEYDENSLTTNITVNGKPLDTSRINGREIEDWVCPFMMRKIKWNGIFEEMVEALGGESKFTIVFNGSEKALAELKEALEDTSVEIVSEKCSENNSDELKKAEELFMHCKFKEAFDIFKSLAENGNSRAMYFLGEYYTYGECGIKADKEQGTYWRKKGAELGDPLAKFGLGFTFEEGSEERNKIIHEIFPKVKLMAENGDVFAQNALSYCYLSGKGVTQDYKEAVKWLKKAAEQGYSQAEYGLGCCYDEGKGVTQDYKEAVKWLKKAAEQGYSQAQYGLGYCYDEGEGVTQNCKEAVKWYTKAAEQGYASAQFMLGECYYHGEGVTEDDKEAVKWYKKATEQNFPDAYYGLGSCYRYGYGVSKDKEKAKELFKKGASLDSELCIEALEDMQKNADRIETAKKIGGGILSFLGDFAAGAAQAYTNSYDDDDDY